MNNNRNLLKKYQTFKISHYIKTNPLLFFFQSNKSNSKVWEKNEQKLKKLKLVYYKIANKIILKTFDNSVYKNFTPLICGVILLLKPNTKKTIEYEIIERTLKHNFSLLCMKLNQKMYSVYETKNVRSFSYKKNMFFLYQATEKYL